MSETSEPLTTSKSETSPRRRVWVKPELDVIALKDAMTGFAYFGGDGIGYS